MTRQQNEDGTVTYAFHLRDDIKWSDGKDVTAEDFRSIPGVVWLTRKQQLTTATCFLRSLMPMRSQPVKKIRLSWAVEASR